MTLQRRTIRGLIAGMLAGFVSWLIIDHTSIFASVINNAAGFVLNRKSEVTQACIGGVFGLLVSCFLTAANQMPEIGNSPIRIRRLIISILAGFFAGAVGLMTGQFVYDILNPRRSDLQPGPTHDQLLSGVIARCAGWAITGMFVGGVQTLSMGKLRGLRDGLIGGIIGGLTGGSVFEAFDTVAANPSLARLGGFIITGAAIGFFTEAVPVLTRKAWLVIDGPKFQGSEVLVDTKILTIGHSDNADIKLPNDPGVAAVHAKLVQAGKFISLMPIDSKAYKSATDKSDDYETTLTQPVTVNGKSVTTITALLAGDSIGIGSHFLRLHRRSQQPTKGVTENPIQAHRSDTKLEKTVHIERIKSPSPSSWVPLDESDVGSVASVKKLAGPGISGTMLIGIQGPYFDHTFLLGAQGAVDVGRDPDCVIALSNDPSVSRNHAKVTLDSGRHYLTDLGSSNGTFINDIKIEKSVAILVTPGDKVRFGDTILRYD